MKSEKFHANSPPRLTVPAATARAAGIQQHRDVGASALGPGGVYARDDAHQPHGRHGVCKPSAPRHAGLRRFLLHGTVRVMGWRKISCPAPMTVRLGFFLPLFSAVASLQYALPGGQQVSLENVPVPTTIYLPKPEPCTLPRNKFKTVG